MFIHTKKSKMFKRFKFIKCSIDNINHQKFFLCTVELKNDYSDTILRSKT